MYKDLNVLLAIFILIQYCICITNAGSVTVSGISSGAYMAVQFHVAFSSVVQGAGVIAGGPYYCANNDVLIATTSCMADPSLINLTELYAATDFAASTLTIDPTSNLASTKVWIYSGMKDTVVVQGVVKKLETYYQHYIDASQINTTYNIPSEHSFVTDNFGNNCSYLGPDYINNCNFNSAYNLLSFILPTEINPPSTTNSSKENFVEIDQSQFIPYGTALDAGLYDYAFAYIPPQCQQRNKGVCSVHIAYHGCLQTIPLIGDTFYVNTGYNEIADTNNLIILYPQAQANTLNPKGCFDWWGYTGADYASQLGVQMLTVKKMLDYLISEYNI
ncbi:polyhydroxybutyrate depolymerase [Heterostelium album PN500]|uniref:Polyhydroxybutyrate depolymerase n=1 Tax=Heterostelium pallidum (strain ATCC 26659 / Pp 5 / PN500) TaxID=670386 RepID=D3B256_HETP5|nr:polyhydroxybutyrate depolymerase [Heterostelium album PN500]EFA84431.1 polyhydroxybutyrate depolymerase [Heterostelium album PN500]|eukprot:XP_020436545.1 polyhydroxybutyrate depolymerase [Heterostelium album PN500]